MYWFGYSVRVKTISIDFQDIVRNWRGSAAYSSSEDWSGLRLATHMRSLAVGTCDCGSFHEAFELAVIVVDVSLNYVKSIS